MKKLLWFAAMLVAASACAQESIPDFDARVAAARTVIQLTGGSQLAVQLMDSMQASLQRVYPSIPDGFWVEIRAEFKVEDMVERVAPIYAKHLTLEDLEQLQVFYKSPVGQRLVKVQPAIVGESLAVGQEWGREVAQRMLDRIKQRGYVKKTD